MLVSQAKQTGEENVEMNFKSGPFALTVSWLLNSYVRGRARKPILLEDRALLLGLRLQEHLQGLGV